MREAVDESPGVGWRADAEQVAEAGEVLGVEGGAGGRGQEQAVHAVGVIEREPEGERATERVAEQDRRAVELA